MATTDLFALDRFKSVEGDELSYNNMCDLDRSLQTLTHIAATYKLNRGAVPFIAIGVKHGNACGVGIGNTSREALMKMVSGDPLALFGGLVMVNFPIDMEEVVILQNAETERKILFDVVVALGFSPSAIEALKRKKGKCRLLENSALSLADIVDVSFIY
jgi:phosphoribosylaminoimidazolecarboxamide formyltransferase/IMP cyclohydrolase